MGVKITLLQICKENRRIENIERIPENNFVMEIIAPIDSKILTNDQREFLGQAIDYLIENKK